MKLVRTLVVLSVLFTTNSSFAIGQNLLERLAIMLASRHEPGSRYCARTAGTKLEIAKRIRVPAKYNQPKAGFTQIYTWTYDPFDPAKPSIIFFEGGPGASSRGRHFALEDYNVIYFDQRGIGCSSPENKKFHKDADFYFSAYTARDADEIRKSYGIEKWAAYGTSYGTVPATQYGHLFPQHTQSVILEGTVYGVNDQLWRSDATLRIANKAYRNLSPEDKELVAMLTKRDPYAFGDLVNQLMYMDDMEENLKKYLAQIRSHLLKENPATSTPNSDENQSELYIAIQTFRMLNCKEFDMLNAPAVAMVFNRANELQFSSSKNRSPAKICKGIKVNNKSAKKNAYQSQKYPLSVPVTYFQGARDGATPGGDAVRHFKNTAKGSKQILIMPEGGHGPNFTRVADSINLHTGQRKLMLGEEHRELVSVQREIFRQAARGEAISQELILKFNSLSKNPWAYAVEF